MGTDWDCECSEDYGACEEHREVLAQREGASTRTADDLVYVFLTDVAAIAQECDAPTDENGRRNLSALLAACTYWDDESHWDDNHGCRWVNDGNGYDIHDDLNAGENVLADLGLVVDWDDGYVISRTLEGCPLLDI